MAEADAALVAVRAVIPEADGVPGSSTNWRRPDASPARRSRSSSTAAGSIGSPRVLLIAVVVDVVVEVVGGDDEVDVTVAEIDPGARRIGLSMVERAKEAKEATEGDERRDTEAHLAKPDDKARFGTLADLLRRRDPPG